MKANRKHKISLIILCVVYFLIYSMMLLGIYSAFQFWVEQKQKTAFMSMEDLLEYERELKEEKYSKIPKNKLSGCSYIVFDGRGTILYASERAISERVTAEDLLLIRDYDNGIFYSVYDYPKGSNGSLYYIQQNLYNSETGFTELLDYCMLDEELNVLDGTLFSERGFLTNREFSFLRGMHQSNENISKWNYETFGGEERTLVLISKMLTEKAYDELMKSTQFVWIVIVAVILGCTALFAYLLRMKMKHMIEELNSKISTCREGGDFQLVKDEIPMEFYETLDTLEVLMNKLELSNREKQKIIADLSHDLKTPLSVVIGCSRAFLENMVPSEERERYMRIILKRSQMAADLIDTLVDYTKMDHPDYRAQLETVDICEYLKLFFVDRFEEMEMAGFELHIELPKKQVWMEIDQKLMGKCLENLLGNALHYNPPGTTVYVRLLKKGDHVSMTFADNGIGMSPEIAERAFDPFVTGNTARSSGSGTGLGLSIVRKIIRMHGGKVQLIMPPKAPYATEFEIIMKIQSS